MSHDARQLAYALESLAEATRFLMACEGGEPAKGNRTAARAWRATRQALLRARDALACGRPLASVPVIGANPSTHEYTLCERCQGDGGPEGAPCYRCEGAGMEAWPAHPYPYP